MQYAVLLPHVVSLIWECFPVIFQCFCLAMNKLTKMKSCFLHYSTTFRFHFAIEWLGTRRMCTVLVAERLTLARESMQIVTLGRKNVQREVGSLSKYITKRSVNVEIQPQLSVTGQRTMLVKDPFIY